MKKDGVNINDYHKNSGLFYQCSICSRQFSEDQKPMKVKLMKSSAGAKIKNKISCYNKLLRGLSYNLF
jgi:hypothetical protein